MLAPAFRALVCCTLVCGSASAQSLAETYRSCFERGTPDIDAAQLRKSLARAKPGKLAARADLYLRVGLALDSGFRRRIGLAHLRALLARLEANPEELWDDFHVVTPLARAVWKARDAGLLAEGELKPLELAAHAAVGAFVRGPRMTHGNRDVSRIAGIATLLRLFGPVGDPDAPWHTARQRVAQFLDHHLALGDLDENAGSYSSLGLLRFLHALEATGRESEWRTAAWLSTFERYRVMVSPTGRMPEWGDDYFKVDPPLHWMFLFERAARVYGDARFAATSRRMLAARRPTGKLEEADLARAVGLLELPALTIEDTEIEAVEIQDGVPPFVGPVVTERVTARGDRVPDKLVLRASDAASSPMVMVDLYCRGDHTHLDKLGSVGFHESGGATHFSNYGRYRQSAAFANLVLATRADRAFPPGDWRPRTWETQSLPLDRLPLVEADSRLERELATMWFRNHPAGEARLWVDNLRLEGPAGVLELDAFDALRWRTEGLGRIEALDGRGRVMRLDLSATTYSGPRYAAVFDPARYSHLRYDVRYEGAKPPKVQTRFPGGYDSWHFVGQETQLAKLGGVRAFAGEGGASHAEIVLDPYLELDSRLVRRLTLLGDGTLVILDRLHVGERLDGWRGGALWQLYGVGMRGRRWFHAPAHEVFRVASAAGVREVRRDHLVKFAVPAAIDASFGVRTVPGGKGGKTTGGTTDLHTAFVSSPLRAGQVATFVTVVRPFDSGADPAAFAAEIDVQFLGGQPRVAIAGQSVELGAGRFSDR